MLENLRDRIFERARLQIMRQIQGSLRRLRVRANLGEMVTNMELFTRSKRDRFLIDTLMLQMKAFG